MFSLEKAREEFYSTLELLKTAQTKEELDDTYEKAKEAKRRLLEVDSEFRAEMKKNERRNELATEKMKKEYDKTLRDAEQASMNKLPLNKDPRFAMNRHRFK